MNTTIPETTTAAYNRFNNDSTPVGYGNWAFAPSTTRRAFDGDVDLSRVEFITGTYSFARKQAEAIFADETCIAVLG